MESDSTNLKQQPVESENEVGNGRVAVIAAIVGNVLVGIVKFIAAWLSGSVAMVSEGIHSIVDSGNGMLVLLGMHRAKKEPDYLHPFGYGKELYFWTLVVALLIFLLGGGISIFKGISSWIEISAGQRALGNPTLNYIVLVLAMIIEGSSLAIAIKQFNVARGDVGPIKFVRDAKDPSLYTVVLEDLAAELGLVAAFIATFICHFTGNLYFDAGASIFIGLLLCGVSIILLTESKGLLVGEGMKHEQLDEIRDIVEADERVLRCGRILTMYIGPDSLLITIDATFKDSILAHEVLLAVDDIERRIKIHFPQTARVFIEAESMRFVLQQQIEEAQWEDEDEDD